MKLITGLFMAWGNFLTVPCPLKKWDNDLKNYMLGFLPSVGLIVGGLIFNALNDKFGNIYPSWLTHMAANFAINTIGFILFGVV